ncbi:MAG: DUF4199 domain-containing protein [Bacteroidota bacterium]
MKKVVLRYGGFSVLVLIAASIIGFIVGKGSDYGTQEVVGYAAIFLSMIFVFFGIKQYRDNVNGGTISYGQAFKVGFLIVLLPSIAFGIFNAIYVKVIDPGFMENYYNVAVQQAQAKMSGAALEQYLKKMEQEKAMYGNLFVSSFVMALTVVIVGVVVTAISALVLQRKPKVQMA